MMSFSVIVLALSVLTFTSASPLTAHPHAPRTSKLATRQSGTCVPNSDGLGVEFLDKFNQEWQIDNGDLTPGTDVVTADVSGVSQFLLLDINGDQMSIVPAADPLNTGIAQSGKNIVTAPAAADDTQLFIITCQQCTPATVGQNFGSNCTVQSVSNNRCVASVDFNTPLKLKDCVDDYEQYFDLTAR